MKKTILLLTSLAVSLLAGTTASAQTTITVNANQPVRTADARWFGLNAPIWDNSLSNPQTIGLVSNMGVQALRFPGGSLSDTFNWAENNSGTKWTTSTADYLNVLTNINGVSMITLNYGSGTSNEAAAWVSYCNGSVVSGYVLGTDQYGFNWRTEGYWADIRRATPLGGDDGYNFLRIGVAAPLGCKYWEVGNEVYGSWETDNNSPAHDPYTYAVRAESYIQLIKTVDPTSKVGVVVTPFTNGYVNNHNHAAKDPVTGYINYGWTPVLLWELYNLSTNTSTKTNFIWPDFAIFHNYPYNPGGESDSGLLANAEGATTSWAYYAANLRGMISDYLGTNGTNIELVCTENNSVSSKPGKQSVSLVNGLYKLDSLGALMQTQFNGLFWWALRNGQETDGNMSSSLYGWRMYGDFGVVDMGSYSDPGLYPTYYTTCLLTNFAQGGDTVISASSTGSLLAAYAMLRQNSNLTVLVINKSSVNTQSATITLGGFNPLPIATAYSYGIPQDNDVDLGSGPTGVAATNFSVSGTNISYSFAPYSATVLSFPTNVVTANAGPNAVICAGNVVTIGGNPTAVGGAGGYTYSWSPTTGLSSSTVANPTATPASTTTYTVTVTDSALNTAQSSATVTVIALPTVNVNSATICAGGSATLKATNNANGPIYLWSPGGATTQSITVSPASTTTYTVTVTDGTTGCANTGSGTVTVHALPTVSVNSATICAGGSATLTATNNASSPAYLWSPGGASTQSITVSPASTTTYTVTVTDGTTGCPNTGSGTVTVHALPTVSVNSATMCAGGSATLTATNNASSPAYLWSPGGATTQSITVSPASTTTYTVTVTDGTTGCANSGSGTVTISAVPAITLGPSPILVYYSSTNASLPYTVTAGAPDNYTIIYDSNAQTAGFSNTARTALPVGAIPLAVPLGVGTNVYNGTVTLYASSTGCSSTNSYPFTVTVTPLPVTLTGSRLYDGTATANASILTIATNYDGTNLTLSGSAALAGSGAGVENITDFSGLTLGGSVAGNYTLSNATGSVTVSGAPLSIAANPVSKTYGTAITLDPTAFTVIGSLVGPETVTAVTMSASGGAAATDPVSGSPYTITPSLATGINGFLAADYNITYDTNSLTVNPLPVVLTGSRAYDGTATAAAGILSVSNAVAGDNVYPAGGSANLAGAGPGPEAITSAGTLALGGAAAGNYTLTGFSGTVTITSPLLTITSSFLDATGSNFVVCWQSMPGVSYNVLTNTSLTAPQPWGIIGGPIMATNTNTCFTLPGGIHANTNVFVVIEQ